MSELSPHGVASLAFAAVVFAAFVRERIPIATVCLTILGVLPLGFALFPLSLPDGAVDPLRFYAGFGHPALVAICALMVLGQGIVVTGALEPVARRRAAWLAKRPRAVLLLVLLGAAAVSGVVNDTPVVVLLIPLLLAAARRAKTSAATMLLPMNYAVLIGGMATTIGTSTNLIVVALAAGLGVGPFSLFSFFPLVAMAAMPALAYLWLVTPWLLARVPAPEEDLSDDAFDAELHVEPGAWLEGKQLREALAATGSRLHVRSLVRRNHMVALLPTIVLRAGDRLLLRDTAANLKDIEAALKARLHDVEERDDDADGAAAAAPAGKDKALAAEAAEPQAKPASVPSAVVAQLIVTPDSPLVGRSIRKERIAERYDVIVVGLRLHQRQEGWLRQDLADRNLAAGDILLVQGEAAAMREAHRDGIGLLLDERFALPRQDRAPLALLTLAAVVLLAATKLLPISMAALGGVLALLLGRCLSWQDVTHSLSIKVVLLVTSSLALGDALQITGATAWLAQQLADASHGLSPAVVAGLLMGLMGLVTNFVSNNAAAAVGTPLGVALAHTLGVDPEPFVLAVLFGCNLCYLTPMGYQTNLLVMNAGGYRFGDFLRVGTPLFLIMWAALSALLAWRYAL
ncbi:MAG: SLC13 family permease [Burkholderiaceae bacterium]